MIAVRPGLLPHYTYKFVIKFKQTTKYYNNLMQVNVKIIQISVLDKIPNIYKTSTITYEEKA